MDGDGGLWDGGGLVLCAGEAGCGCCVVCIGVALLFCCLLLLCLPCSACFAACCCCMTAGWQWWRNAKHDEHGLCHGDVMKLLFSEPELFLSEPSRGAFCEQPAGRRAKSRGACSSHRPAAGTVACRRRRALADPKDVSRSTVTSLTKSCFPGRRRF